MRLRYDIIVLVVLWCVSVWATTVVSASAATRLASKPGFEPGSRPWTWSNEKLPPQANAEVGTQNRGLQDGPRRVTQDYRNTNRLLPMDLRNIKDWLLIDLVLVSDIDGNLHGVERKTGALLWTLPMDEPLVKVVTGKGLNSVRRGSESPDFGSEDEEEEEENVEENGETTGGSSNILWFVEPYNDGALYYFTPNFGLNQLPASIKNLVLELPFSLSGDDKIYTGTRKTSLYTIDINTGEVVSSFGADRSDRSGEARSGGSDNSRESNSKESNSRDFNSGDSNGSSRSSNSKSSNSRSSSCKSSNSRSSNSKTSNSKSSRSSSSNSNTHSNYNSGYSNMDFDPMDSAATVMIGKTTYSLTIHSKSQPLVVWNVTYSQWGPNNIDNDLIMQNQQSSDKMYFTPFHDRSLLAINKDLGTPAWVSKLPALAVNVFDVFHDDYADPLPEHSAYVLLPHPLKVLTDLQLENESSDLVFINKTATQNNQWYAMSYQNYPTLIKSAPMSLYQMSVHGQHNNEPSNRHGQSYEHFAMKNLQVSGEHSDMTNVERVLNGVHQVNRLDSSNSYQPKLVWDDTDSSRRSSSSSGSSSGSSDDSCLPQLGGGREISDVGHKIIDGIRFPEGVEVWQRESAGWKSQDLLLLDGGEQQGQGQVSRGPPPPQFFEQEDTTSVKTLSLIKRICEDVIVILVLLVVLMSFGWLGKLTKKFGKIIKESWNPKDSKILDNTLNLEVSTNSKDAKDVLDDTLNEHLKEVKDSLNDSLEEVLKDSTDPLDSLKDSLDILKISKVSPDSPGSSEDSPEKELLTELLAKKVTISLPETEGDSQTKKKRKRGSRGGRRSKRKNDDEDSNEDTVEDTNEPNSVGTSGEITSVVTTTLIKPIKTPQPVKKLQIENNLVLSDKILGYGSHGTVVFEGTFENRPVAVKRMLLDFFDIASHEVRLLQESDDHPNVIRYFCLQLSELEKFLYIALELCVCSLEDIVEKPAYNLPELRLGTLTDNDPIMNSLLKQLASGLHYLHLLKIVHRDLKPQNILVADIKKIDTKKSSLTTKPQGKPTFEIRLLISDFGLCKKLDADQSSFRATTQHAALGTSGWRAPELLLHNDLLEISPDTISSIGSSSRHSITNSSTTSGTGAGTGGGKRLTKAIDIFSLGCVYYYILTGGYHPFGDRYLREGNIIKGEYDLSLLRKACPLDHVELIDLISSMISHNPRSRPDTHSILRHPFFWTVGKKLEFLLKVSDRFEVERRDPPSELLLKLEAVAAQVHGLDWHCKMDTEFMDNLGKYRKYQTNKLMDLLRALRNKYHHFNDMPDLLQRQLSPLPHGFYRYFNDRFPSLLMEIYFVVHDNLKDEHIFTEYY